MNVINRRLGFLASAIVLTIMALVAVVASEWSQVASGADVSSSGVVLKITAASIPSDLKPVVAFTLTDSKGSPIGISDLDTNGIRFIIAAIQTDPATGNTKYVNYVVNNVTGGTYVAPGGQTVKATLASTTQAAADSGGVFTDLGGGKFTYQFKTAAPASFNVGTTHAIGGYATRSARASVSNDTFYFVPAGGPVTLMREVTKIETCNACHDQLAPHGGTRRDTKLCVLCHTEQSIDANSGNTVDFKVLVHKIHTGANLTNVKAGTPYFIGNSSHDFSEIRWPQDTRNCQTCHQGVQASNYKTRPSAEACGSCHDKVDFKTGANHGGGPQTNATCATCHPADGPEFGLSVAGAHTIPQKSKQLRGVNFEIVSFTNTKPGQNPTVVFNIKDNAGQAIQPSEMAALAFLLSGPTSDYASPAATENALTASKPAGDGNFSYTFTAKIPDGATGTYAVGVQGSMSEVIVDPSGKPLSSGAVSDIGFNKVAYGAVTDAVPMPRKQVVDIKNCNVCHETLALHGGSRRNTEYCVLCHNPQNTDIGKRTTAGGPMPPESIAFGRLIHKIHTGEEQQDKPFIIYGGSPASPGPINLSEARFPTDRRNCSKCHTANSNLLSFMRRGTSPINIKLADGTVAASIPPVQAVCMGCHDGADAKAHADTMTASNGREACRVCHSEGREFSVSKSHAR